MDLDKVDRAKLAKLALNAIDEKIENLEEKQDWCIMVEESTLCELLVTKPFI